MFAPLGSSQEIQWTENTLDPTLVALVKDYHAGNRPTLLGLFRKYPEKQIITFHTRDEAEEWRINVPIIVLE